VGDRVLALARVGRPPQLHPPRLCDAGAVVLRLVEEAAVCLSCLAGAFTRTLKHRDLTASVTFEGLLQHRISLHGAIKCTSATNSKIGTV
jgi:hypothetical protein